MSNLFHFHKTILFLPLFLISSFAIAEPFLTVSCINPPMTKIKFTKIASGEASTQPIQFQINEGTGKPESTINVDKKNKGVCRVTISDGYVIKSGNYFSSITGIDNASDRSKPEELDSIVKVDFRKSGVTSGEFLVSSTEESPHGSVTLTFMVKYAKDD